jgi:putative endonuclease
MKQKKKKKSYYIAKDKHVSPDARQRLGVNGEDYACEYLKQCGLRVIDRNVRYKTGELDIVAVEGKRLCFVEVKTRRSLRYGRPSLSVTREKQHTIRTIAELYIRSHPEYRELIPRLDVLELLVIKDDIYANHIRSAF